MRCAICLRNFNKLRFNSSRIKICGTCVNDLNSYHSVAEESYEILSTRLRNGMHNRALAELAPHIPAWRQAEARRILENFSEEYSNALPGWLNKLAADAKRREKEYKIVRAERRKLLHRDRPQKWGYPSNWSEIASNIRRLDHFACVLCGATDLELHVHHIVYLSNFGTHRQENLVSACRKCHEDEHERELDFGERDSDATSQAAT